VYSLNVPVPGSVGALAGDLGRRLPGARIRQRGERTLVCKRLGTDRDRYHAVEARVRDALSGTAPFAARVTGVDLFEEATTGTSPVVYLAVDSPELERLHRRLCDVFDPVDGIEGEDYTPHVTVARGGDLSRARELAATAVDPVEWSVSALEVWDAERARSVTTVSLPA